MLGRVRLTAIVATALIGVASLAMAGCSKPASAVVTTLGAHVSPTTASEVTTAIDALYTAHPDIASFTAQDVTYSAATRDKVLQVCTQGGEAADAQTLESNQVFACGPLIFFFYTYSKQHTDTQSFQVADDLYAFVATQIQGPFDAASTLSTLLRGWGLPVAARPATSSSTGPATTPEASLITSVKAAMLAQTGVHVVVSEAKTNPKTTATVVADVGRASGIQTLTSGTAEARLRLTPTFAYLSGNSAGLTSFYGISPANATKVGTKWVSIAKGSGEYTNFVQENTISALPASTLPSTQSTSVDTDTVDGALVYVLTWTTVADGTTTPVTVTLDVAATGAPLPITETTSGGGTTETTTFSKWGETIAVPTPTSIIPFTSLGAS